MQNIAYRVAQIQTIKFAFKEIEQEHFNKIFGEGNFLSIDINTSLNIDKDKSTVSIDINSSLIETESENSLVEHSGRTVFAIKGLENTYNELESRFDLPDNLIIQLFAISFSHARALLAVEISPTVYRDKYTLPIIDPKKFILELNK